MPSPQSTVLITLENLAISKSLIGKMVEKNPDVSVDIWPFGDNPQAKIVGFTYFSIKDEFLWFLIDGDGYVARVNSSVFRMIL